MVSKLALFSVLSVLATSAVAAPVAEPTIQTINLTKREIGRSVDHLVERDGSVPAADLGWMAAHQAVTQKKVFASLKNYNQNTGTPLPGSSYSVEQLVNDELESLGINVDEIGQALEGLIPLAKTGNQKRATGAEVLTDQGETYWSGQLTVGTPATTFMVDFDTGSSDFWVESQGCSSCSGTLYNPSGSSSARDTGKSFSVNYADGSSTSGEVYTDVVKLAGFTVNGQNVGAATTVSSNGASFDGLVGMGYQSLSSSNTPPLPFYMKSQGLLSAGSFAMRFSRTNAELYFGGNDASKYTGSITYTPVTQQAYWQVNMGGVSVNGKNVVGQRSAIIDSGTTLIYGPTADVSAFYNGFGNAKTLASFGYSGYDGYYAIPCGSDTSSVAKSVALTFGGVPYKLAYSTMVEQGSVGTANGVNYCVGSVIGSDSMGLGSAWLVGDVFFQNVYITFDMTNNRIGFATGTSIP